jgi:rhodanese-related sulfurtransferase
MNLVTWIVIVGAVVAFLLVKRLSQASPETASDWLSKGALVIDVRSESEFRERHLPNAINIPLNRLGDEIGRYATNKEQPLLLHCLSGGRSGIGASTLKKMGYLNVSNLGSYGRAEKIVGAATGARKQE